MKKNELLMKKENWRTVEKQGNHITEKEETHSVYE